MDLQGLSADQGEPYHLHVNNISINHISSPRVRHQEIPVQLVSNPSDVIEIINEQEKKNFSVGVLLILIAISTWIVGLELVNTVLKGDEYNKPFFLAVMTGTCFSFNLVPELFFFVTSFFYKSEDNESENEFTPLLIESSSEPHLQSQSSSRSYEKLHQYQADDSGPEEMTPGEIIVLAFQVAVIYYLYSVFGMSSLRFTSASNQTVLGSTTAIFTLFIGALLKFDKFTKKKLFCVVVSLMGIIFINVSESSPTSSGPDKLQPKNPKLGNTLALSASFCYAIYLTIMKIKCGTGNKTTNERKLFGYVGLLTALFGIPVLFLVHHLDIEKYEFPPPSMKILIMVLINSFFSYVSDFVTILAMLLTSPLITSLSLTSAIPITIFIDYVVMRFTGGSLGTSNLGLYVTGILSILTSVILINVNIFNENEYIEEIIEEALEDAIRNDEVLSPVLSPLLESSRFTNAFNNSPLPENISVGFNSPLLFKKKNPHLPPPLTREVSGFNLNEASSDALTSIGNSNHNPKLYTIASDGGQENTPEFIVYGGANHHYHVKHIEHNSHIEGRLRESFNSPLERDENRK